MKNIKNQIIFIIATLCFSFTVNAQNVDEIIAKHIKAHGGEKKWEAIKSMKITADFTAFSVLNDFIAHKNSAGEYYSELHLGKFEVKEAFDGKKGWTIDPWQDFSYPRKLNKSEDNVFNQKAEFFTPFYKYKEKGHKVELLDTKKIDGVDVFTIKLTRPNGKTETWYLNSKTYLEYKCESDWVDFARRSPAESFYDDFRKINGVTIPFFIERTFSQRDRILQIKKVEFNVDLDKTLLTMPKSNEIEKLEFLNGNWDATFHVYWKGRWYPQGVTLSKIDFASTNLLQERIEFGIESKTISYSYNSVTKKYRISIFNGLSSNIDILEGGFSSSNFIVDDLNISFGESVKNRTYSQITISKIEKDSFTLEIKKSTDKGKTWNPSDKFTYKRKK